jgi:pyruvate-formate lyase-activating enzyme
MNLAVAHAPESRLSATEGEADPAWSACRFLTCSVLPVRRACNLDCPFCFSKSSISALGSEAGDWDAIDLARYFEFSASRGAQRLVITGGGEPLLLPDVVLRIIREGRRWFEEIACFTNGTYLTRELARALDAAGLSYLCWSRHHDDDERSRQLMGAGAPRLDDFFAAAERLRIRATCVMTQGFIESLGDAERYMRALHAFGVREFTFKHTYVAYRQSVFGESRQNHWAQDHRISLDPFGDQGSMVGTLPWGPRIRMLDDKKVCFYFEPDPDWEKENQLCRSINLLSDGSVYASLEDRRSLLYRQN